MVFERCFENNAEEQIVSCISNDEDYRFWLQGSFNLLTRERRANMLLQYFYIFWSFECIKYIVALIEFYHKMVCFYNLNVKFR